MRKEDLFEALCDIEESYIEEAHKQNGGIRKFTGTKATAVVACVSLVIVTGTLALTYLPPVADNNTYTGENSYMVEQLRKEIAEETSVEDAGIETAMGAAREEGAEVDDNQEGHTVQKENDSADMPADVNGNYHEAVKSNDLTKDIAEIFGGSYLDNNGNFVIVLTEDTPENRTAICKELARSESATIFASGVYSLEYLTELQAKISNAMVNREIPFVVSSGVHEATNNIVVRVTTTDEAQLQLLYELDTIGGAIQVEYCTDAPSHELLILPKTE